jgi:DNA-binding response OmpR family regulator
MRHALIIDDNMAVSRAIKSRLSAFGFDSFDHTWTEQQAREAVALRRPDLIVVGDHVASGSPLEVAREVALVSQAPVLAVTSDRGTFQRSLPNDAKVDGPYPLAQLDAALASAEEPAEERGPSGEQDAGMLLPLSV